MILIKSYLLEKKLDILKGQHSFKLSENWDNFKILRAAVWMTLIVIIWGPHVFNIGIKDIVATNTTCHAWFRPKFYQIVSKYRGPVCEWPHAPHWDSRELRQKDPRPPFLSLTRLMTIKMIWFPNIFAIFLQTQLQILCDILQTQLQILYFCNISVNTIPNVVQYFWNILFRLREQRARHNFASSPARFFL